MIAAPVVRRSLAAFLGLGFTVAVNGTPAEGAQSAPSAPTVTEPRTAEPDDGVDPRPGVVTMRSLEPDLAPVPLEEPTPVEWTVQPGEHLWGIAEATLSVAWSHEPSDAEVADYLAALVDLNRDVLVVPGHPDLVFPGQVFTLPAVPSP